MSAFFNIFQQHEYFITFKGKKDLPKCLYYLAKEIRRAGEENGNSKWDSWEYLDI